jgi:Rhomboid-like protein
MATDPGGLAGRAVLRRLSRLRVAPGYLAVVVGIRAAMCLWADAAARATLVHANSTNVTNLRHGRFYTLLTSTAVLDGRGCLPALLALGIVLGIGELAWGHLGMVALFLYGHLAATILVFAGLVTGLALHKLCQGVAGAADVGPSYGAMAVLGALLAHRTVKHRARWQLAAAVVALTITLLDRTFTDAGHLTALLLGFGAGHIRQRPRHAGRPAVTRPPIRTGGIG